MNLVVNSQALAQELRLLNKIVPTKAPVPILTHALLTGRDGALHFYATDFEIGVVSSCPAEVVMPGVVALPVARLLAMVEQFPNADVTIALDGKLQVRITCGAFKSRLQALSADDFLQIPTLEGESVTLQGPAFQRLLAHTRYAIGEGTAKYLLHGALLVLAGPVAAMVATDGKRLALATMAREGSDAKVVIPTKTLGLLAAQDGDVELTVGPRHLFFKIGNRLVISRTLDGEFPAYDRMIPRANDQTAVIDVYPLAAALRRVGLASGDDSACRLSFSASGLQLAAASQTVGDADEQVSTTYKGEPLEVTCNWRFLLDFLDAASGPSVTIALKDAKSTMLLTDGEQHLGIIMLMASS